MKKKYRMNEVERAQHDKAIRIRKMTDPQLCDYLDKLRSEASGNDVRGFIERLDSLAGTGNGIGKSTVHKLRKFAEQEGYFGKI